MPQRRLLVIANPISGRGNARRLLPQFDELAREAGVDVEVKLTERAGHGRELAAQAAALGFDAVVAVGGDGTVNEVVNGLGPHGLPLMVIPQGTGNVLAKELRASRRVMDYLAAVRDWRIGTRDLGRLSNGRLFSCFVGAGFDGQCTRALAERDGAIHMAQYVPIMWKAVKHSDFTTLRVHSDDRCEAQVSYALVSITPEYGGPMWLTGKAKPDDGRFDVLTVHERITPLSLLKLVSFAMLKRMGSANSTRFFRTGKVKVEADEEVPIQVDGDFAGFLPIEAEVLPGALSFFRR
ncbi:MAG: diacylglycerol kinase family lipid kinase [Planctomycetes bacterium]|nr:diacylglycerol kinase family lipid kinase [Planctomycetota bacterium]MCB9934661.1 diacylglycerol kinase family lipid kinase [Planctomycetota bacterium]